MQVGFGLFFPVKKGLTIRHRLNQANDPRERVILN